MKNKYWILILLGTTLSLFLACEGNKKHHQAVLEQAYQFGDVNTAIMAAQSLYSQDSVSNVHLLDTLVSLYTSKNAFASILALNDLHGQNFTSFNSLELIANAQSKLNLKKEAIATLEKMEAAFPDKTIAIQYQLAENQFTLKAFPKSLSYLEKVINNPKSKTETTTIFYDNQAQTLSYGVAALNMMGVILLQQKKWKEATAVFEKVINLAPDFQLAKNNLTFLQQMKEKEK